ncbi:MAG: hypothetical protein U5K37_12280 [Natrialbaceae archaeon]|nr:hypothetical protein [Natrialbaceae archaeon]
MAELDSDGYDGRCVWVWPGAGDVLVENCELQTRGNHYAIVTRDGVDHLTVRNTSFDTGFHGGYRTGDSSTIDFGDGIDNDPQAYVPDGVPTSAEEAAGSSIDYGGDHPDLKHIFEFVAEDTDEPTDYYFEIEDGPIKPSTANGATIEESLTWVSEDGSRAAGRVAGGRHAWEFDTLLVDVTVEGPATPIINGSESYLERYPLEGATGDEWKGDMPWHQSSEGNLLVIDGSETTGSTSYEFEVSGSVEKSNDADACDRRW